MRKYGGSPATEQINGGIKSVDLAGKDSSASSEGSKNANTSLEGGDTSVNLDNSSINNASFQVDNDDSERDTHHTEEPDHSEAHTDGSVATTIKQRRELLDNQLKNYKQEKMKRKLPVDSQMLCCAQEELKIKRRLVEQMDKMDKLYAENMERMSNTMEKLTQSISDGFALLKQPIAHHQYLPPNMYHPPAFNPYMQGPYNTMPNYQSSHSSSPPLIHLDPFPHHVICLTPMNVMT